MPYKNGVPKDKKRKWDKNYRIRHKDELRENARIYYLKTKDLTREKRMANQRKWRVENREKYLEQNRRQYYNNPLRRIQKYVSNMKRQRLLSNLTVETVQRVYEDNIKKYGTLTCYLCMQVIVFGRDNLEHKIPVSRGGSNLYENLAISCSKCNNKKGTKTEQEYNAEVCYR